MNTADLDKYYQDTFSLVRTMVIKIEAIARRDNTMLRKAGFSVSDDKETWRYYMNLNGEYHQTDDVMMIQSIDTGEEIVFNKTNLNYHTLTKREYAKGGYWFNRLLDVYPHQSTLINGILSPIPYSETIKAADYKILRYNKNLVLWNEDQLIPKLQTFINGVTSTLFGHEYMVTDNLFLPLMLQQLYADIIKAILSIRIEDIYTRHTHEFFIWSHISSFGDFDRYKTALSKEQTMWLFRNIAWIKNNPGQQYTFDKLVDNLLSKANIPLAKYDMVETTETQIDDLKPTPLYRRLPINLLEDYGRTPTFVSTERVILKQQTLTRENYKQTAYYLNDAVTKGQDSLHSELPTKVLESTMLDYTNKHNETLMSVVLNEWIYLASKGVFRGAVIVSDPKTGKQIRIGVEDGYNLWAYLIRVSEGENPLDICPARFQKVLDLNPPSFEELLSIAGEDYISPKMITDIRDMWFPVATFIAPDYLIQYSSDVYWLMWKYKKLYSQFYDLNKRARVRHATNRMFLAGAVSLGTHDNYDSLLEEYEIDLEGYSVDECKSFAWEIFKRITGWDTNSQPSTGAKQAALVDLMMQLSSYTIHTITEIEDGSSTIELINETYVGDSSLVGEGNALDGDFSNVRITLDSNLDCDAILSSLTNLEDEEFLKPQSTSEGFAKITDNSVFEAFNPTSDLRKYAVKFPSNDYLFLEPMSMTPLDRVIEEKKMDGFYPPAQPEVLVVPPTPLGELQIPDLRTVLLPTPLGGLDIPDLRTVLSPTPLGELDITDPRTVLEPTPLGNLIVT